MCNCKKKNCGCNPDPCNNQTDCTCPVLIKSDCVNKVTVEMECLGIDKDLPMNEFLTQLDTKICELFGSLTNFLTLINVGGGAEVFKQTNVLGQKELRTLVEEGLVTVTQNDSTITIGLDEDALTEYIQNNQFTYSVTNLGNGGSVGLYEGAVTTGNDTEFQFKSITSETIRIVDNGDGTVSIENPTTSSIPALYVNKAHVITEDEWVALGSQPYKGFGTLSAPFTDTITGYVAGVPTKVPNTSIQNALDAYVGSGDELDPELLGQRIIVQDAGSTYTFPGDFNYSGLDILIQGNVYSTTTGYLLDMDGANFVEDVQVTITIEEDRLLQIAGDGFRNSGNDIATTNYAVSKICRLSGEGTIFAPDNNTTKYILSADPDSDINGSTGNNNDGNLCFEVRCVLRADYQGVYKVGGKSRIDFYNSIRSGLITNTVDTDLQAFLQTGGQVRCFQGSQIFFAGGTRTDAIVFTPTDGFIPSFVGQQTVFNGNTINLFTKTNTDATVLEVTNSPSGYGLQVTNVFDSPNLWSVTFTNNTLQSGTIDKTKADLTGSNARSATNTIGGNLIEILRVYGSRSNAAAAGLPPGAAFINRQTVNAGSFVSGTSYVIVTIGTTDFTTIGAASNTVGLNFIATGVGTGDGTAYQWTRDVLI